MKPRAKLKTLGTKVPMKVYKKFCEKADSLGITPSKLLRQLVEQSLSNQTPNHIQNTRS